MSNKTTVEIIDLGENINQKETEYLRGAINKILKPEDSIFHNHIDDKLAYKYPLIQYKSINNKATIVALNEGIRAIKGLFPKTVELLLKNRSIYITPNYKKAQENVFDIEGNNTYKISNWLPFNQKNFKIYNESSSLIEKIKILEKILCGNILSSAKGLGCFFEDRIVIEILDIESIETLYYKGNPMKSLTISFKTNCTIPLFISLGKGASIGFGTITPK